MASAKQILGLEPPAVVKQEASPNTAADPLLLSSATEYVQAPTRADQSTFATGPTLDLAAPDRSRSERHGAELIDVARRRRHPRVLRRDAVSWIISLALPFLPRLVAL